MADQRIIVIGASAGGVEALVEIVRELPEDLPAPICVVLHVPPDSPSLLARILQSRTRIRVVEAQNGDSLQAGTLYVAPPDKHLLVRPDGTIRTARGPRENRHRPAVDPLFRSAAVAFGPNAIGVILTGGLDDGTAGLRAIKKRGGTALVQDPKDALHPGMPSSAIEHVEVDFILPLPELARQIVAAARIPPVPDAGVPADREMITEVRMAELEPGAFHTDQRPGEPSPYSCPDCGGVLWEIRDGDYHRYRCRVGHAFSPENMLGAQAGVLEAALWTAAKTLEENARLSQRLARDERSRGREWLASRFDEREREARDRVEIIRRFLLENDTSEIPAEVSQTKTSRE